MPSWGEPDILKVTKEAMMTMPIDLVLVRHGQSEQNKALKAVRGGNQSLITHGFLHTPDSQFRLSALGREQAQITGRWLQEKGLGFFDRRYVSDYARAKETAALLDLEGPNWYVEPTLREREWGVLDSLSWEEREEKMIVESRKKETDPFYWVPPNGESIAQMTVRLRGLLDTLHRECSDKRVIVVCHGEVMWGMRFMLERMSTTKWIQLERSQEPGVRIYNCQVLHYTRRNPESGELSAHLDWFRSDCPQQPENCGPGWQQVERETFSNEELLLQAEKSPHLFE